MAATPAKILAKPPHARAISLLFGLLLFAVAALLFALTQGALHFSLSD